MLPTSRLLTLNIYFLFLVPLTAASYFIRDYNGSAAGFGLSFPCMKFLVKNVNCERRLEGDRVKSISKMKG